MQLQLPTFETLIDKFPHNRFGDTLVKKTIGGLVNADYVSNTCAVRISRGLNYAGKEHQIPRDIPNPGGKVVPGDDKLRYILTVKVMKDYLKWRYGNPKVSIIIKKNQPTNVSAVFNTKGIICFDTSIWVDATGHFTLWDGADILSGNHNMQYYFAHADAIYIWPC